jgi:hypothetical protein
MTYLVCTSIALSVLVSISVRAEVATVFAVLEGGRIPVSCSVTFPLGAEGMLTYVTAITVFVADELVARSEQRHCENRKTKKNN